MDGLVPMSHVPLVERAERCHAAARPRAPLFGTALCSAFWLSGRDKDLGTYGNGRSEIRPPADHETSPCRNASLPSHPSHPSHWATEAYTGLNASGVLLPMFSPLLYLLSGIRIPE